MSWLKNALSAAHAPKESIIGILKHNLGGQHPGRSRDVVHASDISEDHFCPRKWAFLDLKNAKTAPETVPVAMDVTFQMGNAAETLLMESWAGDAAVGNWRCRYCGDNRTMMSNPGGFCKDGRKHWWQYLQITSIAERYDVSWSIDGLFNVGSPQLLMTEIKTWNTKEFEKIIVPLPEHRLRTNLYLKLMDESDHPYRSRFNLHEARVLYISRGYGIMNSQWKEILPFKEFVVKRNDVDTKLALQKALALKMFRVNKPMPSGICATALDKVAKECSCCPECFSGQFPAQLKVEELVI